MGGKRFTIKVASGAELVKFFAVGAEAGHKGGIFAVGIGRI